MNFKSNINKIHYELSNCFGEVSVLEKSSLEYGNYIELCINENNKTIKTIIKKPELEFKRFNWLYRSNPNNDNSILIERNSSVDGFVEDIKDIFEKNRFDSDYIRSIKI